MKSLFYGNFGGLGLEPLAGRHCLIRDYFFLRDPRDLAAVAMEYRSKALRFYKKLLLSLELLPA